MTEEVICTSCRKFVKYIVREAEDYVTLCDHKGKNHIIPYTRKYAYCIHCGKEVYVPEIEDYNANEPIKQWHKRKRRNQMKVADTFPYFSAKTSILVTEGVGKVLFDGDRNEMPEELEELTATRFEFLFHERKFWVAVEAQKSKEEKHTPVETKEEPYAKNCGNCAFFDHKTYKCRVTREEKNNPPRSICCAYAGYNGAIDVNDYNYQYQIIARNALLDTSGVGDVSEVACADCAFFNKERKKCFLCFSTNINETFVCGQGKKRSDYE